MWLGAVFVRGWVCGGRDFFIFSFILGRRRGACAVCERVAA